MQQVRLYQVRHINSKTLVRFHEGMLIINKV